MLNNGGGGTYQLHGCLKLEEGFYLLQNTASSSKAIDDVTPLCMSYTAVDWLSYGKS